MKLGCAHCEIHLMLQYGRIGFGRLQVLMRQRELGLSQLAGTQDMQIDGTPSFASPSKGKHATL